MPKKQTKTRKPIKAPTQMNFENVQEYLDFEKKYEHCQPNTLVTYEHYADKLLDWAGDRYLYKAPSFKVSFPEYLDKLTKGDGEPFSDHFISGACSFARRFFSYAIGEIPYYDGKKIRTKFISSIKAIEKPAKIDDIVFYSLEDMLRIAAVDCPTMMMRRTQAAIVFLFLSGMRITAFFTLPISAVDLKEYTVRQEPAIGVYTKLNKANITALYTIPGLIEIVEDWDKLVRKECPENSTWYARMTNRGDFDPKIIQNRDRMNKATYKEAHDPNYKRFTEELKKLCELAGVDYKSPHKGRYGYIHEGMKEAKTMHAFQSVAQNVLDKLPTILNVYARMGYKDSIKTVREFSFNQRTKNTDRNSNPQLISIAEEVPGYSQLGIEDKQYIDDLIKRLSGK